jgi:hypothetical protein
MAILVYTEFGLANPIPSSIFRWEKRDELLLLRRLGLLSKTAGDFILRYEVLAFPSKQLGSCRAPTRESESRSGEGIFESPHTIPDSAFEAETRSVHRINLL